MNGWEGEPPPLKLNVPDHAMDDPDPTPAPQEAQINALVTQLELQADRGDLTSAKALIRLGINLSRHMDSLLVGLGGRRPAWDVFAEASKDFTEFPVTVDDKNHQPPHWVKLLPVGENRHRADGAKKQDRLFEWLRESVVLFHDVRKLGPDSDLAFTISRLEKKVISLPDLTEKSRKDWAKVLVDHLEGSYAPHPDHDFPEWLVGEGLGRTQMENRTRPKRVKEEIRKTKADMEQTSKSSPEYPKLAEKLEDLEAKVTAAKVTKADVGGHLRVLIEDRLLRFL